MLSLKAHCCKFIIDEEIMFKKEEVPIELFEDLRQLNSLKNLLIEEQILLRKMKIIECEISFCTYDEELYSNMLEDELIWRFDMELYSNMLEDELIWCFDLENISDLEKKKDISKKNKVIYLCWKEKIQSDLNQIVDEQEFTCDSIAEEYQNIKFKLDFENIPIFNNHKNHDDMFLNEIL